MLKKEKKQEKNGEKKEKIKVFHFCVSKFATVANWI